MCHMHDMHNPVNPVDGSSLNAPAASLKQEIGSSHLGRDVRHVAAIHRNNRVNRLHNSHNPLITTYTTAQINFQQAYNMYNRYNIPRAGR